MAYSTLPTVVTGTPIASATWGNVIKANFDAAFPLGVDAWTSWSSTLTNLTLGNGVVVSKYQRIGRSIHWRFKFTLGSTSAVGTGPQFSLPTTPHAEYVQWDTMGNSTLIDVSAAGIYNAVVILTTAGASNVIFQRIGGSGSAAVGVTALVPMTWAVGDILTANGTYESAT